MSNAKASKTSEAFFQSAKTTFNGKMAQIFEWVSDMNEQQAWYKQFWPWF